MKRVLWLLLLLLFQDTVSACLLIKSVSQNGRGGSVSLLGSAVCIGRYGDSESVLLTARHLAGDGAVLWVQDNTGEWQRCRGIVRHPELDVAILIAPTRVKPTKLAGFEPVSGRPVKVFGAGPYANGDKESPISFEGVLASNEKLKGTSNDELVGYDGLHIIPGDSGGPVIQDGVCVGICSLVTVPEWSEPPTRRDQYKNQHSVFVKTCEIVDWIETQYSCPNGNCPIQLEPVVQQPMIGLGVPWGPPRVVQQAVPARPRYVPESSSPRPVPDSSFSEKEIDVTVAVNAAVRQWLDENADRIKGRDGTNGRDGKSPSREEVADLVVSVVTQVIEENPDRFRGQSGRVDTSEIRAIVQQEMAKKPDISIKSLESRVSALESTPTRLILTRDKKIIDDQEYPKGKPLVIDLEMVLSNAKK